MSKEGKRLTAYPACQPGTDAQVRPKSSPPTSIPHVGKPLFSLRARRWPWTHGTGRGLDGGWTILQPLAATVQAAFDETEAELRDADKMDEVWRSKGIKSRTESLRSAIAAYLTQLGACDVAALFSKQGT